MTEPGAQPPASPTTDPQWLTIEDICGELGLGVSVVRRLIRGGHLPAKRLEHTSGGRFVVKRSDLEAWLSESREATRRFVTEQPAPGLGMWDRETGTPARTPPSSGCRRRSASVPVEDPPEG